MRKIKAFLFLTINGYYKASHDDISWHAHGEEGTRFSEKQLASDSILLFGRKTYEIMSSFWPTPIAHHSFPKIAERMNQAEKLVLSNTIVHPEWNHTKVLRGDVIKQIQQLKNTSGKDITILGSGSVVSQLTDAGLIDEYQLLIDPVAIGEGTSLFEHMQSNLDLVYVTSEVFPKSGSILLTYHRKG